MIPLAITTGSQIGHKAHFRICTPKLMKNTLKCTFGGMIKITEIIFTSDANNIAKICQLNCNLCMLWGPDQF